jgi:hypothetical protein
MNLVNQYNKIVFYDDLKVGDIVLALGFHNETPINARNTFDLSLYDKYVITKIEHRCEEVDCHLFRDEHYCWHDRLFIEGRKLNTNFTRRSLCLCYLNLASRHGISLVNRHG